jgi:hypothetical protein
MHKAPGRFHEPYFPGISLEGQFCSEGSRFGGFSFSSLTTVA